METINLITKLCIGDKEKIIYNPRLRYNYAIVVLNLRMQII
jgi:hypothetical protein